MDDIEGLFAEVHPGLLRYCFRMTGDADVAADAAQEAFVRLLDRGVQGTPPELRAWLYKVATHRIRDRFRTAENRRRLLVQHPVKPSPAEHPEQAVVRAEDVAWVRSALQHLSERDQSLLLMREEGFSYSEMAEAVDVAPGSVGTLLARALKRFAREIKGNE